MTRPTGRTVLPRGLAARLSQVRRDVSMISRGFRGEHPAPFRVRGGVGARDTIAARSSLLAPRELVVVRIVRETADAVTLILRDPTGATVPFAAGQFFTLILEIGGQEHRRAYSACTSALDASEVGVTVKRVEGGRVSNHVVDRLREGDRVYVLGPSGSFTVPTEGASTRRLVLVAGGSGITPLLSIARTVLASEPDAKIALLYGNRGEADIISADALAGLAASYPERFVVRHVLSAPPADWTGGRGILDRATASAELAGLALAADPCAEFYVCGPDAMMTEVGRALVDRGVAAERIREERFTSPHLRAQSRTPVRLVSAATLTVRVDGEVRSLGAPAARTILEAGLAAGLPMPFSCAMGGCGACKVKVVSGAVDMEEPNCLSPEERARGFVLACVGCVTEDTVVEVAK